MWHFAICGPYISGDLRICGPNYFLLTLNLQKSTNTYLILLPTNISLKCAFVKVQCAAAEFRFGLLEIGGYSTTARDHQFIDKVGSLKMNTALEYSTRVVQEGDRRCKKSTLNDLAYLTPLRIPLMNPGIIWVELYVAFFKHSKLTTTFGLWDSSVSLYG
jgi:hypothetical protein